MQYDLLVRGGTVASSAGLEQADIAIESGRIAAIGDLGGVSALEVIDARNLVVMPGAIDSQVHFREPGLEHKEDLESGTRAALVGGVTAILEMPNTNPTTTSAAALADKLKRADGRAWCHYGFFVGASKENLSELAVLEELDGTPGIKIFVGSSTGPLLVDSDEDLLRAFQTGHKRIAIHAEDETRNRERKGLISSDPHPREHPFLRDSESACIATRRVLDLSEKTGRPVHILHISTAEEPTIIAEAKKKGVRVTAEVTPQHLYFAGPECYDRLGTLAQMNPPVRSEADREGLWRALNAGVFDVFGSDHAPHTLEEKAKPYPSSPSGMPGVQTLLPVLLTFVHQGKLSMTTLVKMLCETPAALYGIRGRGKIEVGYAADLTLVDPKRSYVFDRKDVQSKCGWSPYEGETLTGSVQAVILDGDIALDEGTLVGRPSGNQLVFEK